MCRMCSTDNEPNDKPHHVTQLTSNFDTFFVTLCGAHVNANTCADVMPGPICCGS
jgi:hypothetical protein